MPDLFVAENKTKKAGHAPVAKNKPQDRATKLHALVSETLGPRRARTFSAFIPEPVNMRFETQDTHEDILLLVRRHPITNLSWLLVTLLLIFIPILTLDFNPLSFLPENFQLIIYLVWYLMTFAYFFQKFLSWFFNVGIITDERIVDVDFPSLLFKHISEAQIEQVQDVNMRVAGFIRSLLNFGTVTIQTAGTIPEICFEDVPNPERVAKIINQLKEEQEHEAK